MDTMQAFAMGEASRGQPSRVFDWVRAAKLIRERKPRLASAGLQGDWEWTGGEIFRDGTPVPEDDTYVYLSSTWAIPELDLDGDTFDCWVWASDTPGWGPNTYWPPEAMAELAG